MAIGRGDRLVVPHRHRVHHAQLPAARRRHCAPVEVEAPAPAQVREGRQLRRGVGPEGGDGAHLHEARLARVGAAAAAGHVPGGMAHKCHGGLRQREVEALADGDEAVQEAPRQHHVVIHHQQPVEGAVGGRIQEHVQVLELAAVKIARLRMSREGGRRRACGAEHEPHPVARAQQLLHRLRQAVGGWPVHRQHQHLAHGSPRGQLVELAPGAAQAGAGVEGRVAERARHGAAHPGHVSGLAREKALGLGHPVHLGRTASSTRPAEWAPITRPCGQARRSVCHPHPASTRSSRLRPGATPRRAS
jgi:hypothetical protein